MKALDILMVEDSITDARLIVKELEKSGRAIHTHRVDTPEDLRKALERSWDLVLSDWSMPRFSALAALRLVKEHDVDLPFIIVSGTVGEDMAVEAMRAGAHDYVLKDRLSRLVPAIERELRELTERRAHRRAQDALRESEARFRKLAESGVIGIITADLSGDVIDANDAYLGMVGYSRQDLRERAVNWKALTPPECADLAARAAEQLLATGIAPAWETESHRKDGSRFPVLVGVAMLDDVRAIAFIADLTERNRAEEGRRRAEDALLASEEQLRQAQKMEAVGRLAGGVAHDFNNILSVILGYGALILEGLTSSDPMRADVEEITRAAGRAADLTRQLLAFSRRQVVEPQVLDFAGVLSGMEKMLQRLLGEDIELVFVAPVSEGRVRADKTQLEQVVLNLVVNARDAMPRGGQLTIETANVVLDAAYAASHVGAQIGPHVMLAITDTGCGMDKATQSRMFEPFFTTKEVGKGTGLGLSTAFGIVQQNGGTIWVYSEVGRGTTMKVFLPRVDDDAIPPRPQAPPGKLGGTETILLVEDEEQVRTIAISILTRQGYRVVAAQHPAEALRLCQANADTIHLLLTDVVMPQMSGPELASRLAASRPDMKLLCMSGYTDDSIVRHGVLHSNTAFLQKPFTLESLARRVREVLDAPSPARS